MGPNILVAFVRNMDTLNAIVAVPRWAYDFCNYYLIMAAIMVLYGVYALFKLFTLPGMIKKFIPTTTIAIGLILSIALSVVLSMMQFWICRSALAPVVGKEKFQDVKAKSGSVMKKEGFHANMSNGGMLALPSFTREGFAVKCSGDADCQAVMGMPQGSTCSCGSRGLCGGCTMQNNMEPQMSFSSEFAPFAEGFRVSRH
jgi:hypothetical protein